MNENFNWTKGPNTLYEILQIQPNSRPEIVKSAYRTLQRIHHPDRGGTDNLASKINQAYGVLIDQDRRKQYDKFLRETNSKLIGNYEVIDVIGEGGFGVTYKAKHILLDELACLKQNINISSEDTDIMVQEAKLLWKIHHYSLPTLRDFFKAKDGSCVFAMTYVKGPTIDKIVGKKGGIDPENVCWMTQRLLNALHYLHFNGVVHCDVKPNNIIINPEEHNAVLVDYGFSTIKPGKFTKPTGYTVAFAAPELLSGKPPLPETDLYSLGKTMIYALGGDPMRGTYPNNVPTKIQNFFDQLVLYNTLERPNWTKKDLVKELSNLRQEVFGRRRSNSDLKI